jgi:hypothetical protein
MVSKGPRCCTVARDRPLSLELSRNCTSPDSDKRSFYVLRSLAFALVRTVKWNDRIKSPPHWGPARISKAPWTWSLLLDYTTPLYPLFCPNGLFHLFLLTSSCDNDSECQTRKASMRPRCLLFASPAPNLSVSETLARASSRAKRGLASDWRLLLWETERMSRSSFSAWRRCGSEPVSGRGRRRRGERRVAGLGNRVEAVRICDQNQRRAKNRGQIIYSFSGGQGRTCKSSTALPSSRFSFCARFGIAG